MIDQLIRLTSFHAASINVSALNFSVPTFTDVIFFLFAITSIHLFAGMLIGFLYDAIHTYFPRFYVNKKMLGAFLLGGFLVGFFMFVSSEDILRIEVGEALVLLIVPAIFISISLGLVYVGARIYKGLRHGRKLAIAGLIFTVLLFTAFLFQDPIREFKRAQITPPPANVIQKADQHIIDQVGEDYFNENYRLREGRSRKPGNNWYYISYEFLPLQKYGGYFVSISVRPGDVSGTVPNCQGSTTECQFNMTAEEFEEIRKQYDLDTITLWSPPLINYRSCEESRVVEINYITGEVSSREEACVETL